MHTKKKLRAERKHAFQRAVAEFFRDPRFAELLGEQKFLLVDGGAKGGLQKEWLPLMPLLEVIGLEPLWPADIEDHVKSVYHVGDRPASVSATSPATKKKAYPSTTSFVPMALGGEQGVRSFHVTRGPSMSSFLRPDPERTRLYGMQGDAEIRRTVEVETTTLDAIVRDRNLPFVDFVKLDTQGSELEILSGGASTIGALAFGLRIETSFVPLYENQPLFADVDAHVRRQGFEFVDFTHLKRYHRVSSAVPEPGGWSDGGQLVVADPLYFRAPSSAVAHVAVLADTDRNRYLTGALIACLVYGRTDYARDVLALAGHLIEPQVAVVMRELLHAYPAFPGSQVDNATTVEMQARSIGLRGWRSLSHPFGGRRGQTRSDRRQPRGRGAEGKKADAEERKAERKTHANEAMAAFFQDHRFSELLRDEKFVLLDGGARGGVPKEWYPVMPHLRVIAVEPRWTPEIRARGLVAEDTHVAANTTFIPLALAGEEGTRSLHVTRGGSMSSFLKPDLERLHLYGLDWGGEIVHTTSVKTTTLDSIVEKYDLRFVDFVKLDTQGTELEILRGGTRTIGRLAFGLRVETCLTGLYENQPIFSDVDPFVRSHGFEFVDFVHPKRFLRAGPAVVRPDKKVRANDVPGVGGQLVSEDALYFRAPDGVVALMEMLAGTDRHRYLVGALIVCLTYGRHDYAADLIAISDTLVDRRVADLMRELVLAYPHGGTTESA